MGQRVGAQALGLPAYIRKTLCRQCSRRHARTVRNGTDTCLGCWLATRTPRGVLTPTSTSRTSNGGCTKWASTPGRRGMPTVDARTTGSPHARWLKGRQSQLLCRGIAPAIGDRAGGPGAELAQGNDVGRRAVLGLRPLHRKARTHRRAGGGHRKLRGGLPLCRPV